MSNCDCAGEIDREPFVEIRTVLGIPRHDDRNAHVTHRKTMFNRNDLTQKHFDCYETFRIDSLTMYLAIVKVSVNSKNLAFLPEAISRP